MHKYLCWSSICELRDDGIEFFKGETFIWWSFMVDWSIVHHLHNIVIIQVLMKLLSNGPELFKINHSVLILIEQGEDPLQSIFGLGFPYSWADDIEEFRKLDRFVLFSKSMDER